MGPQYTMTTLAGCSLLPAFFRLRRSFQMLSAALHTFSRDPLWLEHTSRRHLCAGITDSTKHYVMIVIAYLL